MGARSEGKRAAEAGRGRTSNPHRLGTPKHREWASGWESGCQSYEHDKWVKNPILGGILGFGPKNPLW
jgi:hypothetical protein